MLSQIQLTEITTSLILLSLLNQLRAQTRLQKSSVLPKACIIGTGLLINELAPNYDHLSAFTTSFLKEGLSDKEKIAAIFKWVQSNIQYVAFEDGLAGFKPAAAAGVVKVKYGDCKGIANLLVNLLKSNGFDARHAWIGTRSNNYNYSIPSLVVDNHMICALQYNEKTYYLDATGKSALWEVAPPHLEGKEVMISDGDSFIVNTIPTSKPERNIISISGKLNIGAQVPTVSLHVNIKGHFKSDFMGYYTYSSIEDKQSLPYYFMKKYVDGVTIEEANNIVFHENEVSFDIVGSFHRFARNASSITVFPFFNTPKL